MFVILVFSVKAKNTKSRSDNASNSQSILELRSPQIPENSHNIFPWEEVTPDQLLSKYWYRFFKAIFVTIIISFLLKDLKTIKERVGIPPHSVTNPIHTFNQSKVNDTSTPLKIAGRVSQFADHRISLFGTSLVTDFVQNGYSPEWTSPPLLEVSPITNGGYRSKDQKLFMNEIQSMLQLGAIIYLV
ncbi:hypothetical protein RclHR1_17360003 [Rhizophagus clarus]|uniref:Uncharacterized protein n=1 Tax=Rhizophagus clarus TaxID=94130 RepID=A0A2Z6QJX1_9GLOM|nr:hypothetical protein RclHR1_17360003 [Rhizophagus clarus]GES80961.1 hypothetical protein GLOIN_2v1840614 [Rhizophagus clarus]